MGTTRQRFVERMTVLLGVSVSVGVSFGFVEPSWPSVSHVIIPSPKVRRDSSIRLVHLSDLHSEAEPFIEGEVIETVRQQKPDIIVFTGDAINETAGLPVLRATMTALAQIAPTYSVRGNWETWWFPSLDLVSKTSVRALDGRAESISIRGQVIWLLGVGVDHEATLRSVRASVPKDGFTILLHHFPALAPRAAALELDVMLAGDTHGGQIALPILGELVRIQRYGLWRPSGLHREGTLWLYVNRGLGNEGGVPRVRLGCRPEIAVIDLVGH